MDEAERDLAIPSTMWNPVPSYRNCWLLERLVAGRACVSLQTKTTASNRLVAATSRKMLDTSGRPWQMDRLSTCEFCHVLGGVSNGRGVGAARNIATMDVSEATFVRELRGNRGVFHCRRSERIWLQAAGLRRCVLKVRVLVHRADLE